MQMSSILRFFRMTSSHEQLHLWKTFSSHFSVCHAHYAWMHEDICIPEEKMLQDPRRLYAPGRLYHIVERKPLRLGRFPPVVRTAVPVDGGFEHIVLSCNATSDHAIIWIERESQRAMALMLEKDRVMEIPPKQRTERQKTLAREHSEEYKAALQRAVSLSVPHAFSPSQYGTFDKSEDNGENSHKSSSESSIGLSGQSKHKKAGINRSKVFLTKMNLATWCLRNHIGMIDVNLGIT